LIEAAYGGDMYTEMKADRLLDKFQAAMVLSTAGDALGWPTEMGRYPRAVPNKQGRPYLDNFIEWEKLVGGRFWGYREKIRPGSYSDDTQLTLSLARCLTDQGDLDPNKFAYFELPLWLHYERGGGRAVKLAARTITRSRREWWRNFYKVGDITYRNAGANGAAMRALPLGLVNVQNEQRLYRDAFLNTIITHGHPRAIIGGVLYPAMAAYLIRASKLDRKEFLDFAKNVVVDFPAALVQDQYLRTWIQEWDKEPLNELTFKENLDLIKRETVDYLGAIEGFLNRPDEDYYKYTGALSAAFRGSGTSTVCVALYLLLKYHEEPVKAVLSAVNTLQSDADTIANFVGGLAGSYYGMTVVPKQWIEYIQDRDYILRVARILHQISQGQVATNCALAGDISKEQALLRIIAWEIGLREMFWDALAEGEHLVHPALGGGIIKRKEVKRMMKQGYETKLIEVQFDCGQTCVFHSRVATDGHIGESLLEDALAGLGSYLTRRLRPIGLKGGKKYQIRRNEHMIGVKEDQGRLL
jgi:ADP-ribosylglycohydrolase